MKKRVLVLNCGALTGTDINVALKENEEFEVWGASTYKNHAVYVYQNYIDDIPNMSEPNFIQVLNEKIAEYNFKFIIVTHEDLVLFLQKHKDEINATIVSSNYDTALLCRYKSKTYEKMKDYDFVPKVYKKEEVKEYPVFVKKDDDQGARHAYKVTNKEELDMYAKDNMIICEYLPGDEATIDCFTDKNRRLVFCNPRATDRMLAGIDVHARRMALTDEIRHIAESLNKEIEFRGFWFFQIKQDKNGKYKLLEIATRLAGSFSLSRCLDVNLPELALKDFDGQDIEISFNNVPIEADKEFFGKYYLGIEYNKVFLDFESSLKSREKVDTFLMLFLYQCVNKNISINMITENKNETLEYLEKNKVSMKLFDNIYTKDELENLVDSSSILISDNDKQKANIRKSKNINCFSNNIIESLIDWRS